jgi:L-ascorbate metabolism protein UlaG (beta-lactamase superfamily)
LAFLPTGDPSPTASPQDAFNMASDLKPSVVVAIHGSSSQSKDFENRIKGAMPNTTVIIPEPFTLKVVSLSKKR